MSFHPVAAFLERIGSRQVGKRQENNKFQAQCIVAALVYFVPQDRTVQFSFDFLVLSFEPAL